MALAVGERTIFRFWRKYTVNQSQTTTWTRERYILVMALVAILGLSWIVAARVPAGTKRHVAQVPKPGFLAPDFTLESLDGEQITLSQYRGHPVIINFWATWCPPCRSEMPAIVQEYERYKGRGLVVLAVDNGEDPEKVVPFREAYRMTFPVLLDKAMRVAEMYHIRALPTTFFIAPDGTITDMVVGGMNKSTVQVHVRRLMEGR